MAQSALLNQVDLIRGMTVAGANQVPAEVATIIPTGFNNNILWNLGHILTTTEVMMFGPEQAFVHIPAHYKALFSMGTKPADWTGDVPTLATIAEQLAEQPARIKEVFANRLDEPLAKPFTLRNGSVISTFGEMLTFSLFHEGTHVGYIMALKRAIGQQA